MELFVFNEERKLAGVVDSFEYLRWTRRYTQSGSFELKAPATKNNVNLLAIGNYLWKRDDDDAGIIEYISLDDSVTDTITVGGRFALSLLSRRIIWGTEILNGGLSACVGQLLQNHIIAPTDPNRQIPFIYYINTAITDTVKTQVSYDNLMDTVVRLSEAADVGIRAVFDPDAGTIGFQLYNGIDSPTVFSSEYENLTSQTFTQSFLSTADTALVGGEGEGAERVLVTVGGTSSGALRREVFVDARDLQSEDFGGDYTEALIYRGQSKLAELQPARSLDASINPYGGLIYKVDYDVGFKVKIVSKKWGVSMDTRIAEIEETYDTDGLTLDVTFGKGLLTLSQKLKQG